MLDDGTALYDSPVICEYLDALDGKPQLFPLDRKLRMPALRRQALGDGFLDLLVLARNRRPREQARAIAAEVIDEAALVATLAVRAQGHDRRP